MMLKKTTVKLKLKLNTSLVLLLPSIIPSKVFHTDIINSSLSSKRFNRRRSSRRNKKCICMYKSILTSIRQT